MSTGRGAGQRGEGVCAGCGFSDVYGVSKWTRPACGTVAESRRQRFGSLLYVCKWQIKPWEWTRFARLCGEREERRDGKTMAEDGSGGSEICMTSEGEAPARSLVLKQQAATGRDRGGSGVSEAKGRERSQSSRVSEGQVHEV